MSVGAAVSSATADTVLTVSSWASPKHTMNANVFPWMNEELKSCSRRKPELERDEYGLASPLANMIQFVMELRISHGWSTAIRQVSLRQRRLPSYLDYMGNLRPYPAAFQATWEKHLSAANEAKGVEILTNFVHGPGMVHTVKPISSYKDLRGMRVRVGGGVANDIGEVLGIAGVNVPAPKVYETISSGVADGVFFSIGDYACV